MAPPVKGHKQKSILHFRRFSGKMVRFFSFILTHTHTHTHSHSHTLTLTHTHKMVRFLSFVLTHTHSHSHTHKMVRFFSFVLLLFCALFILCLSFPTHLHTVPVCLSPHLSVSPPVYLQTCLSPNVLTHAHTKHTHTYIHTYQPQTIHIKEQ